MRALPLVSAVCLCLAAPAVAAEECPAPSLDADAIIALLQKIPNCEQAFAAFEACSAGSTMDVQFAQVVIRTCEGRFLSKLSHGDRGRYAIAQRRCRRKYRREEGTLYRALEAGCAAKVARDNARRFPAPSDLSTR